MVLCGFFFFQAEDGIRDRLVTGVQTCALPISSNLPDLKQEFSDIPHEKGTLSMARSSDPNSGNKIGRASCRERV